MAVTLIVTVILNVTVTVIVIVIVLGQALAHGCPPPHVVRAPVADAGTETD